MKDHETGATLRLVLILMAVATAVVVATEFIVVGLLPVLARDLKVSVTDAGHLVGVFALAAAILGPPLTLAATAQPPRRVLGLTLLLYAAGNIVAVLVPCYLVLLLVRAVQGAALPVFVSTGSAVVIALAARERRGAALAHANIGFIIGIVVALPAGVALAEAGEWMTSFIALSVAAIAAAMLVAIFFPAVELAQPPSWNRQAALLIRPLFVSHLVLSVAIFTAMFAAYTYLAAWLDQVAGQTAIQIAVTLAIFGAAGMIGNMAAARFADRATLRATMAALVILVTAVILSSYVHGAPLLLFPLLAIWGAAHMAAITLCQVRVTLAGHTAPAFAMAMNIASANLGIALGAVAGGFVVDAWGVNAIGWGAAGLMVIVAAAAAVTAALERNAGSRIPPANRGRKAHAARASEVLRIANTSATDPRRASR